MEKCPICTGDCLPVAQLPTGTLEKCNLCHWLFSIGVPLKPIEKANLSKDKSDEYLSIVQKATAFSGLGPSERVLDINSGDGLLLGWYLKNTVTVGVEPNVTLMKEALQAQRVDVPIMENFSPAAIRIRGEFPAFKIITAIDILQDYVHPLDFLINCHTLLADDGVLVIQVPNFQQLYKGDAEDFSLDQHYFLTYTIKNALQNAKLELQGIEVLKKGIRAYATKLNNKRFAISDFNDKLRLYTSMNQSIINELHNRFDLTETYKALENKLHPNKQITRNELIPTKPTPNQKTLPISEGKPPSVRVME
jgi:2-polyprenyl-3-methyl-5-hydroxy-6-metoxy-1,4-benzoquinol methylase